LVLLRNGTICCCCVSLFTLCCHARVHSDSIVDSRALCSLSLSLTNALSRGCSLSLSHECSLSILWFVVVFTLVVFSSLMMASIWIDRAVVALRSFFVLFSCNVPRTLFTIPCFRRDVLVLLFVHDQYVCIVVL
jgi:hypothetical protein